jgi:hypothetical protein
MSISIEDEHAIVELYSRAIHAFDMGDQTWLDYWAEKPEFVFPGDEASGRPAMVIDTREGLAGMVTQAFAMMEGRGMHYFSNFAFDQVDGGVRVRAYLLLAVNGASMMEPAVIRQNTRIDDLVVQQEGRWLFKRRSVGATW